MYKNTKHTVEITDFGTEGEGIAKIDGYTVFVPSAVKGDIAEILVVKENKSFGYGKLLEVMRPSPLRTEPLCPVFSKCGGCSMQAVKYENQLEYKKSRVLEALRRIGGFKDAKISSVTPSHNCYYYRNKAQFPVTITNDAIGAGFYAPHSHRVVVTKECSLQDKRTNGVLKTVISWANEHKISAYSEETKKGVLRRICMRVGKNEGSLILVCTKKPHFTDELTKMILSSHPFIKGIILNYNNKLTNNIYGEKDEIIFGVPYIYDYIGDVKYKIHYKSFYQVNPYTTQLLYEKALDLCGDVGNKTVFDLYCGTGTISLFLAKKAKKVIGIEIVEDAVKNARENAELNAAANAEFYCGKAEELAPKIIEGGRTADVVVLDPPRKGCEKGLLFSIADMKPERIVYVSCDAGTMARDARILCDCGYTLKEAHVFDQFPQTAHVETVILLQQLSLPEWK